MCGKWLEDEANGSEGSGREAEGIFPLAWIGRESAGLGTGFAGEPWTTGRRDGAAREGRGASGALVSMSRRAFPSNDLDRVRDEADRFKKLVSCTLKRRQTPE